MWWTSAVVVDLPLVPVIPTTLCGGKLRPRPCEQFDIADDFDARFFRAPGDRVAVKRQAGGDDDRVEPREVGVHEILNCGALGNCRARFLAVIPRRYLRPARQQRLHRRKAAPRKPQHRIMPAREGLGRDHRSLSVDSPASARTKLMIQKRITTVGSLQPRCSK